MEATNVPVLHIPGQIISFIKFEHVFAWSPWILFTSPLLPFLMRAFLLVTSSLFVWGGGFTQLIEDNEALGKQHSHAAAELDQVTQFYESFRKHNYHAAAQPDPYEALGKQHSHAAAQPDQVAQFHEALGEQHSHAAAQPDPNEALGEQHSHAPGHQDELHGTAAWQLFPLKHSLIV
jgi:hypothetical protein